MLLIRLLPTHPAWLRAVVPGQVSSAMCCGCFVCCLLLMGSIIVFCLSVVKTFFAYWRSIFYLAIKFTYAQKSKMFCKFLFSYYTNDMTPQDIVLFFGSQAEAGRQLGVTRAIVSYWEKRNIVPVSTQLKIEVATRGKLKADKSLIKKIRRAT